MEKNVFCFVWIIQVEVTYFCPIVIPDYWHEISFTVYSKRWDNDPMDSKRTGGKKTPARYVAASCRASRVYMSL